MSEGLRRSVRYLCCVFVLLPGFLLTAASPSYALQVSPLRIDLDSSGRGTTGSVSVVNTKDTAAPIELSIFNRRGDRPDTPADEDFLIFPPTAVLQPGATQVFRVQWLGDPALPTSQSYYLSASELPVELPKDTSTIQLLFKINLALHVSPPDARPAPKVVAALLEQAEEGKGTILKAQIDNEGNRYTYTNKMKIKIEGAGKETVLLPEDIEERDANAFIPPKTRTPIEISLGDETWAEPINVSLELIEEEN